MREEYYHMKKKVWRIDFGTFSEDRNGPYYDDALKVVAFVADVLSRGFKHIHIEEQEMTQKQFDKLGEWQGI